MNLDDEAAALKSRISTAARVPAYDHAEAAKITTPANYVLVSLEPRFGGAARMDGTRDTDLRRLTTTVVAKTVSNVLELLDRLFTEFAYSEVSYESQDGPPKPDDGYYSIAVDWTYSI